MIRCQLCKSHHGVWELKVGKDLIYVCPLCADKDPSLRKQLPKNT